MKTTVDVCESDVRFKIKKSLIRFKIYHNLPNTPGMDIEGAIDNWVARTESFTAQSLCDYILSKKVYGIFAYTESEFNHLRKSGKIKEPINSFKR